MSGQIQRGTLTPPAKQLIIWVAGIASVILATALTQWHSYDPSRLAIWTLLAIFSGTVKLRFHNVGGSYSYGFIVVLAAMAVLTFPETIAVSVVSALVQSCWLPRKWPKLVQILFNISNFAISGACAWCTFHGLEYIPADLGVPTRFVLGTIVFFWANTGLVSWILSLLSQQGFLEVWRRSFLLILPYYLAGAACAAALVWIGKETSLLATLLPMLPLLGLLYWFARLWIPKATTPASV